MSGASLIQYCILIRDQYSLLAKKVIRVNTRVKVKVKCTLVQALRLSTGRKAHRRSRGKVLLFLDHRTRRE
jgi:hypothetical protein